MDTGEITKAEDKLKPCPFCGSEVVYGYINSKGGDIIWITCQNCEMEIRQYYNKKSLFEVWNRRTNPIEIIDNDLVNIGDDVLVKMKVSYLTDDLFSEDDEYGVRRNCPKSKIVARIRGGV